jgi:hypothetical protein
VHIAVRPREASVKRVLVSAFLVVLTASAWARDPWKDKPYKSWDAGDVRKILFDSPWSKRITRTALQAPDAPAEDVSGVDMMGSHSREAEAGGDTQQTMYVVRWVSSRTLREAWARSMVLQKQISPESIDQHLPPVPGEFLLAVVGPDLAAFARADESTLKNKSYLAVNKEKIAPARVEVDHEKDGRVAGVVFHFPKTDTAGHALISSSDKNVRFVEGGAGTGFEVNFSPRQMVDSQGPDL